MAAVGLAALTGWAGEAETNAVKAVTIHPLPVNRYTFNRYRIILERKPFGADPLQQGGEQTSSPAQQAQTVAEEAAKQLRLCFLMEGTDGEIRAGFQNLKAKPGDSRSVILREGESFAGMKLVNIDIAGSKATLEKDGVPLVFELAKAPVPATPATRTPTNMRTPPPRPARTRRPPPPPRPRLSPEEQRRRREAVRAHLQQYQMEVIRKGMPPLPIPLTPEQDAELVREGILPPRE